MLARCPWTDCGRTIIVTKRSCLLSRAVVPDAGIARKVNLLYVDVRAPEAQILLKVKFASVDRNANTQLGMNLPSTGAAKTIGSVTTGQFFAPGAPAVGPGAPVASTITDALSQFLLPARSEPGSHYRGAAGQRTPPDSFRTQRPRREW